MNERHNEMNRINAGAGRPVTASGQPEAARSRHGGAGRRVTGQPMMWQMSRVFSLLAVIVALWSGVALAATVTLYPATNTPTGTVTNPTNAYANDDISADVSCNSSTLTVAGFNNIDLGVISDVTAYVKYKTSATPSNDTYAFDAAVDGSTFSTSIVAANITNQTAYVTTAGTSFGALTWAQVGTLAIKNTTAKSGPSDGYLVNWDVAYIVVTYTLDSTAPTVSSVAVQTGLTVDVTFSEAMGTGVTTASNYAVSGTGRGTLANNPNSVALVSGNTYRLTWSTGEMLNGGNITITVANAQDSAGNTIGSPNSGTHTGGAIGVAPTVTINQAGAQADPTGTSPINFTVVFSESVSNFATGDVAITGTAGGTKTATVTGSGTTYNVAVTGMTTAGTVIASINAGVATDAAGNGNTASTSTDNSVSWTTGPTCTRNAPTFSITPATQNVKTNQSVVYTLSVTNNDTAECADSSTFNIAITSETGDTAAFTLPSVRSATSVSVAAGANNSTVTLTVTSAVAAVDGKALTSLLTLSDAVNHSGMNQTDSVVTTVANFNPMIHSSRSTGSLKWSAQNGWGIAGGQYGEFKCATCHVRNAAPNIKRVRNALPTTTDPVAPVTSALPGTTVSFRAVTGADSFGDDQRADKTTSTLVCSACHTQTSVHRYNSSAVTDTNHMSANQGDCISCHLHSKGFGASCTTCHPTYPEPPATNAHVTHAGSTGYAYACTVCHPQDHDGTAADITFTGVAATWAGATYTSSDKTCSSLYCHGSTPADWDAGTGGSCGDCHGAAITGRPNGVGEPTGGSHLTGSHQAAACTACHSHDGTDKTEHVNGPANANGDALVSSAGTSITTYTYGTTLASSPDPDGYKYSGGTCATSCHSDGVWGGSGGCTFCHGGSGLYYPQSTTAPNRIAEHAKHIAALEVKLGYTAGTTDDTQQKAMCAYCHNDTNGIGGTGHNDGGVAEVGAFNPMWNGATSDTNGALDAPKTCSNIDCHYNTLTADTWYGTGTATCTYCHAGDVTYTANSLPNVHNKHVDETADGGYNMTCATCHSASTSYVNTHANGSSGAEVAFSGAVATLTGTQTYSGAATKVCSNLYCHGPLRTADWDAPSGGACGDCHGDANGRPDGANEPPGGSHLTTSHQVACANCHSHDGSDKAEHVNGRANTNGDALVSGAGTSIGGYAYGGAQHANSPDADGFRYTGGTCSTVTCHGNGTWGGTGGCNFCHGGVDGSGNPQYWPDGTGSGYADSTAGAHDNHVLALAEHLYSITTLDNLRADATTDVKQKAICAFCHPSPGGTDHHLDSGDQRVDILAAGSFLTYNGAAASKTDTTSGAYSLANLNCSNLACHNQVATPSGASNWNTPPASPTCAICHTGAGASQRHDVHVTTKGYACTQCHTNVGTYPTGSGAALRHADGQVQLVWNNAGSFEQSFGGGSVTYSQAAPLPYKDATWGTCASSACHNNKPSPAWDATATGVCTICHTAGGANVDPTSGVHAGTPTVSGVAHDDSFTNGTSTFGCATCHSSMPATATSTHVDGFNNGNTVANMGLNASMNYVQSVANVGTCFGSGNTGLTGCHNGAGDNGTWKRLWDASVSYQTNGTECKGCHGGFNNDWTFGSTANTTDGSVEHNRNWDGDGTPSEVIGNHSNDTNKMCNTCHVYGDGAYVWGTHHRNNQITMNSTMGYQRTTTTPNYGCTNTCHSSNTNHGMENSNWTLGTLVGPSLSCTSCHTGAVGTTGALKVSSSSAHVTRGTKAGMNTFNSCNDCHPEHTGGVLVPNNAAVGINYTAGGRTGFRLGGTATTGTTEAEICWNCHSNTTTYQTTAISEWGVNTMQTGAPAPLAAFNYGTVSTPNWTTATWTSAQSTLFAYKTGAIQSTHSANSAGTSTVTATAGYFTETKDSVANIRCSYCHDVHNTASGVVAGDVSGKPFLRGSWWTNPYKEDGAPTGAYNAYSTTPVYGAVPRGYSATLNANNTAYGGWQIDQNNNNPTVAAGYTGVNWTYANSAGLCALCHTSTVNGMNWNTTENGGASLWVGTNGHNNAVIGGTGTSAANIYNPTTRNEGATVTNPKMGYQLGNTNRLYGLRNNAGNSNVTSNGTTYIGATADGVGVYPYAGVGATAQVRYAYQTSTGAGNTGVWGVDQSTTTAQTQYHKFSCSKCHNPHASRLPKLMITNCLDVSHNTWDDNFSNDGDWTLGESNGTVTNWSTVGIFPTGTESAGNNKEFAYAKSAQNCHRYIDNNGNGTIATGDAGGDEPGWNKVTPWK